MSDTNAARCPACQAQLRLKNGSLRGRKISCPKCGKAFVVPTPAVEGNDDIFLPDTEAAHDSAAEPSNRRPPIQRSSGKPAKQRRNSARPAWLVPGLTAGGALVALIIALILAPGKWFGRGSPGNAGTPTQLAQDAAAGAADQTSSGPTGAGDRAPASMQHVRGTWTSADEWLVSPADPVALHQLAERPHENYTLTLRARRLTGKNAFAIGIPVGDRQVLVALDTHDGSVSGLELLDGKQANDNEAAYRGRLLFPDREVTIQCAVRNDRITCTCDGVKIVDWKGDLHKLSLPPDFTVLDKKALFLATVRSRVAVRDIKVSGPSDAISAPPEVAKNASPVPPVATRADGAEIADEDTESTQTENAETATARARKQLARYAPKLQLPDKNQVIDARISLASRPGLVAKVDKVGPDGTVVLVSPGEEPDADVAFAAGSLTLSKGDGLAIVGDPNVDPDGMHFLRVAVVEVGKTRSAKLKVSKSALDKITPGDSMIVIRVDGAAAADLKKAPEIADLGYFGTTPIDGAPWKVLLGASFNNLKQIGLGLYNFESSYGSFPPAALIGPDGKPWHSWRVMLLPYVDAHATFDAYKWDEPWDGPNNSKLLDQMPAVYADPAYFALTGKRDEKYYTNYVAIRSEGMAFRGLDLMFDGKELPSEFVPAGTTLEQFRDGTDKTLMVGHVGPERKIPWMKPEDIVVTGKLPKLGQPGSFDLLPYKTDQGAVSPFLRADGRAFGIRDTIDERMLHSLMTIAGGEKIDWTSVPSIGSDRLRSPEESGEGIPVLYLVRIGKETKARLVMEPAKKRK
jgi:predicted Zn finger-like uncharacterized protein